MPLRIQPEDIETRTQGMRECAIITFPMQPD